MKSVIIYASVHHGNTEKLVKAISDAMDVELIDATKVQQKDLNEYDLIGFASGIYAFKYHQAVCKFAKNNLPKGKNIFFMSTSASNKSFTDSIIEAVDGKEAHVLGEFHCNGYNTFGPFKLVGGTSKGKPDAKDLENAVEFYKSLLK